MSDTPMSYAAEPGPRPADVGRGAGWVVFGAGGHARSVIDVLERLGEVVVAVIGDGGADQEADDAAGIERVVSEGLRAVVAIGAGPARTALLDRLVSRSASSADGGPGPLSDRGRVAPAVVAPAVVAPAVVASTATVAPGVSLGAGTVVLEHAHVGPGSRVGRGVIVNTGAIVEHDCVVGDSVHVAPGAVLLGGASVGRNTLVGSGARLLPGVVVGSDVRVGAGAVVAESVPDGKTVVGVPARATDARGTRTEQAAEPDAAHVDREVTP